MLAAHLVDVDVVVVRRVVDGFEEALELAGGPPVDRQDERNADRFGRVALGRVLVPLHVSVGFTCEDRNNASQHKAQQSHSDCGAVAAARLR